MASEQYLYIIFVVDMLSLNIVIGYIDIGTTHTYKKGLLSWFYKLM